MTANCSNHRYSHSLLTRFHCSLIAVLAAGLLLSLCATLSVQAQEASVQGTGTCSQADIDKLPTPAPMGGAHRVVQLVNCSSVVLLGGANAAHQKGALGLPVFPREGTWVMQPYGTVDSQGNPLYVLTIDIPTGWERTNCPRNNHGKKMDKCPALGPNFWARTGCRYDISANRAQCETGGCAGQYDCSSGAWGAPGFTSITEWTFYQPLTDSHDGKLYHVDNPDISLVNGSSLNVDMEAVDIPGVGGDEAPCPAGPLKGQNVCSPIYPHVDQGWLMYNYPLTVHGNDLRANDKASNQSCTDANGNSFLLKRSDIDKSGKFGYIIEDVNGKPVMPPGDNPLACFTNCGKYEYPGTPATGCDPTTDLDCYAWKTYCAPNGGYDQNCTSDADCARIMGVDVHASCYFNNPSMQTMGKCALRAFYQTPSMECPIGTPTYAPPGSPASLVACTYVYGSENPLDSQIIWSAQPPADPCSDVTYPPGQMNGTPVPCVGDDTIHQVFHGAYTWPNDPEVYGGDSPLYRVIFAPGGTTVPITPAQSSIPLCSALPPNYNYVHNYQHGVNTPCLVPVEHEGAVFAVANDLPYDPNKSDWHWACAIDQKGSGDQGVLCRWNPAPTTPSGCAPPVTDQIVTKSACGLIDGSPKTGITLLSSSFQPNNNDPLFLEVTIPQVLNPVNLPTSITGCASSWTQVPGGSQMINNNQGLIAWYSGVANTSSSCQVTVTLAAANPAALKVYDVPSFNGHVETTSTASGNWDGKPPAGVPYGTVYAQTAPVTTSFANDLVLGGLLQVNQQLTPMTYWVNWLTNSLAAPPNNYDCQKSGMISDDFCPTDDGTDYLPSHGPYTSNSDAGHDCVIPGMHALSRTTQPIPAYNWGGAAIYLEITQACPMN